MNKESFKKLVTALGPFIDEIKDLYSTVEVYSSDSKHKPTKTEYWNGIIALIDNGENHLLSKLGKGCRNIDRHKQAGLLLVALLKNPLFVVNYGQKNSSVGYYSASLVFAWKSALSLLADYVIKDLGTPKDYAIYLENNSISMPSANYETETLRTIELCFPHSMECKKKKQAHWCRAWKSRAENDIRCRLIGEYEKKHKKRGMPIKEINAEWKKIKEWLSKPSTLEFYVEEKIDKCFKITLPQKTKLPISGLSVKKGI